MSPTTSFVCAGLSGLLLVSTPAYSQNDDTPQSPITLPPADDFSEKAEQSDAALAPPSTSAKAYSDTPKTIEIEDTALIAAVAADESFQPLPQMAAQTTEDQPASVPQENTPPATAAETPASNDNPPEQPVGRAPKPDKQVAADVAALEPRGVLTPRGTFILEPGLQYSYDTSNRVALIGLSVIPALTIGLIDIRSINRNTFVGSLAARYGLTNRLEIETKVPYVYRDDSTVTRQLAMPSSTDTVFNSDGNDIGDVEFGVRYQVNQPRSGPFYVANLRLKTRTGKGPFEVPIDVLTQLEAELPTGSGFYGVQPSITAVYPSDPAVFFGSLSYLWNIDRDIDGRGNVDPGDVVGFNFGMGFGLNERTSFSIGYDHNVIGKTDQSAATLSNVLTTQVGSVTFGYSYRLDDQRSVILNLGVGATDPAPDVQLTLRIPMSF